MKRKNRFDSLLKTFTIQNGLVNTSNLFNQEINFSYEKGNVRSKIDHILTSKRTSNKILNSQIITHELDMSDHNALQLKIELKFDSENCIIAKKPIHKFDWKNEKFKNDFRQNVKKNMENSNKFYWNINDPINSLIDINITSLTKILIKCAREAEKDQIRLQKSLNLVKQDPKIKFLSYKLKKLNFEDKLTNIKTAYHSIQYKNLKKEIRKLQRLNLSNKEKKSSQTGKHDEL